MARLTAAQVRVIRNRYARGGITGRVLAAEYGVTSATIYFVLRGLTWPDAGGPLVPSQGLRIGERNSAALLSENDVRTIRARRAAGEQQKALAAEYGVSTGTISHIVRRLTWQHV